LDIATIGSKKIDNKVPAELEGLINLLAEMLADEFLKEYNMNEFWE
jgi:hypothetical protein